MSIIFVLIPLAVIIVAIAIGVFFWAVKSNQFDDLERQGYSILFDDDIKQDKAHQSDEETNEKTDEESDKPEHAENTEKAERIVSDQGDKQKHE